MVNMRRKIEQTGYIDANKTYTMVEASRVMTASVEMLRDYVSKGLIKRINDGKSVISISGAELVRYIADTEKERKTAALQSMERARERERERRQKKREETRAAKQDALFKAVPSKEPASLEKTLQALSLEIRALRAEVTALKR
jgi:hypothetical protein